MSGAKVEKLCPKLNTCEVKDILPDMMRQYLEMGSPHSSKGRPDNKEINEKETIG